MLSVQRRFPLDYSKCNQTVTVYHKDGETFTRTVHRNAFLDFRKTRNVEKTGGKETNSFLLVIPCKEPCVYPEDKVLLGEGAEVTAMDEWRKLIPATVPGLVVVKYVDPKYWDGRMCHVEAGG